MRRLVLLTGVGLALFAGLQACSGSDDKSDPTDASAEIASDATIDQTTPSDTSPDVASDNASDLLATPDGDASDTQQPPVEDPGIRMRSAGWMSGDLHLHTQYSDGDDTVAIVIALAEYLQDATFLASHRDYVGNPVDFIALTDHRTTAHHADPDFHSDKIVVIPGEEFGGPGHAGVWGLAEHIPHDPDGDGATSADYANGATQAHAQNALFSMNHPFTPDILFAWDVREHDAMEICNCAWALMGPSLTPEKLSEWETAKNMTATPVYRKATQYQGMGGNQQTLKLYEAQLSRGQHIAVVGGSDRHVLFPVGFPSTWVKATSRDVQGVLEGIRKRHTFVGRTPASATLELTVEVNGDTFEMGDQIPLASDGTEVKVTIRVGKADQGLLKLVQGHYVPSDEELESAELGQVVFETSVEGVDFTTQTTLTVKAGDWFYPIVYETVVAPGLPQQQQDEIPGMIAAASGFTEENVSPLIEALWDYIDPKVTLTPTKCDPANWNPLHLQCLPPDTNGIATYFFPDWISRALNVVMEEGAATQWTLGAVGSAVMFQNP